MNYIRSSKRRKRSGESGYALLMAVFLAASLFLFAAMATPSVLTQGRREREQETVWRGNQYVRAIHLYYEKNGHFPQTLEDLTKPNATGVHFLRKVYTDPMNAEDGTWRFIYVSPSGQLIGSVRYHSLQEMAIMQGMGGGTLPASPVTQGSAAQTGTAQQGSGQPSSSFGAASSTQPAPLAELAPVDGPVLGGSLVGVGGKIKQPSLRVYQGGKTYYQWEFIWNPLANAMGQAVPGTAAPAGNAGAPTVSPGPAGTGNNPASFPPDIAPTQTPTPAP